MTPRINDGSRPSRLALGKDRVGEQALPASQRELPSSRAWAADVEAGQPPALDIARLREIADRGERQTVPSASGMLLFRRWIPLAGVAFAAAAAFAIFVGPPQIDGPNRVKGEAELSFMLLREGQPTPGNPDQTVRAGDMIQFTYRSWSDQLVLVGVDGRGGVVAYFPDEGDSPVRVIPGERHVLDGSILLDDAPGPELFVAYFGEARVSDVKTLVRDEFQAGGIDAVVALDARRPDIALLVLDKE